MYTGLRYVITIDMYLGIDISNVFLGPSFDKCNIEASVFSGLDSTAFRKLCAGGGFGMFGKGGSVSCWIVNKIVN